MKKKIIISAFFSIAILAGNGFCSEDDHSIKINYLDKEKYVTADETQKPQAPLIQRFPNLPGWPVIINTPFNYNQSISRPIVTDFDRDGENEVIFCVNFNSDIFKVYAYSITGLLEEGWPIQLQGIIDGGTGSTPALGDVDGDGSKELVITAKIYDGNEYQGHIYVVRSDGSIVDWQVPGLYLSLPVVFDIYPNQDSPEEIIVCSHNSLYIFNGDGDILPGFPVYIGTVISGPAIGDIDRDGEKEIVVADFIGGGYIHIFNSRGIEERSRDLGAGFRLTPVLADIDNDGYLEIIVAENNTGTIYALDWELNTKPGWPYELLEPAIPQALSVSDFTPDSGLEIIMYSVGAFDLLSVIRSNGILANGWPYEFPVFPDITLRGGITSGDIDDDGFKEIVLTGGGSVYAFENNGAFAQRYPFSIGERNNSFSEVVLEDVNGDGRLEFVFSDSYYVLSREGINYLNIITLPYDNHRFLNDWSIFQHDYKREGCYLRD